MGGRPTFRKILIVKGIHEAFLIRSLWNTHEKKSPKSGCAMYFWHTKIKEIGGTGKHARSKFLRYDDDDDDDDDDDVGDDDAGGDDGEEVPQFYI